MRRFRSLYLFIFIFFCLLFLGTVISHDVKAEALLGSEVITGKINITAASTSATATGAAVVAEIKPVVIYATYSGNSVIVGDKLDESKVTVQVLYSDDTIATLTTGFSLSETVISKKGANKIIVFYKGKQSDITVIGKEVSYISAYTERSSVSVGNGVDKNDLYVTAYYDDGTIDVIKDYEITGIPISKVGLQQITIMYHNKTCKVDIYGSEAKQVKSLFAEFMGDQQIAGSEIDRLKLSVMAVYTDSSTEKLTTYTLSKLAAATGEQIVTVTYQNISTTFKVNCIEKKAVSLTVKYSGKPVVVGQQLEKEDLEVTVEFNSGEKSIVTDYTMYSRTVSAIGANYLRVYYGEQQAEFIVEGIEEEEITFDYSYDFSVSRNKNKAQIKIALPTYFEQSRITGKNLKASKVKKVIRKLKGVEEYIPFTIKFEDEKDEEELPFDIRITIPKAYVLADTALYFTPNRKSIIAKLTAEVINDNTIQIRIKQAGTYLLVYTPTKEKTNDDDD